LVAGADAGGQKRQMQRAGSGIDGDCVLRAAIGGKFPLEGGDLVTQHILRGAEHAQNGGVDLALDALILRFQIEEGDHAMRLACSSSISRPRCASDWLAASSMRTTRNPACPSAVGVSL